MEPFEAWEAGKWRYFFPQQLFSCWEKKQLERNLLKRATWTFQVLRISNCIVWVEGVPACKKGSGIRWFSKSLLTQDILWFLIWSVTFHSVHISDSSASLIDWLFYSSSQEWLMWLLPFFQTEHTSARCKNHLVHSSQTLEKGNKAISKC